MSIELHCPQCQKLIRAPDDAGGKRGKCPYCGNSVYIPMPPDQSEEIGLAPVDEEDERRERELRRETIQYVAAVDKVTDLGPATGGDDAPTGAAQDPNEFIDVAAEVDAFVVAMRESKLKDADGAAARLVRAGARGYDYVQGLLVDELPLEVANVPPRVVQGFLKALLKRFD